MAEPTRKPGRPRKRTEDRQVRLNITLPPDLLAWLKAQPGGPAKWIAAAIANARELVDARQ